MLGRPDFTISETPRQCRVTLLQPRLASAVSRKCLKNMEMLVSAQGFEPWTY